MKDSYTLRPEVGILCSCLVKETKIRVLWGNLWPWTKKTLPCHMTMLRIEPCLHQNNIEHFFFTPESDSRVCWLLGTRMVHDDALYLISHFHSRATLEPTRIKTQVSRVETSVFPWNFRPGCDRKKLIKLEAIQMKKCKSGTFLSAPLKVHLRKISCLDVYFLIQVWTFLMVSLSPNSVCLLSSVAVLHTWE